MDRLPKCDHCKHPSHLQSDGRGGMICDTCAKQDHGERQEIKARGVEPEDLMAEIAKLDGPKSMDRNRPYDGQAHTDQGVRGRQPITGLTFRDLNDCFIRAVLLSACHLVPKLYDEACKGENAKLNGGDLYGFDLDALDPIAIGRNLSCEVERVMGIFPNIPGNSGV